jgi:hypothetical protein
MTSTSSLDYPLQNGFIHNWLVAGPLAIPVTDLDRFQRGDLKLQIARHYYQSGSGVTQTPIERAPFESEDSGLTWNNVRCLDDHLVDLSAFYPTCHYLRTWAYAQVVSDATTTSPREVTAVLTTHGPADVWVNGEHVHRQEHFLQVPHSVPFALPLRQGTNEILVRLEEVALRECPYAMALQIVGIDKARIAVCLPTSIPSIARRQKLEKVFQAAYMEREVYRANDRIIVRWADDLSESVELTVRLQTPSGRIYAESHIAGQAGAHSILGLASQFSDSHYQAVIMPRPREYYESEVRVKRAIGLETFKRPYAQAPYGTYQERRKEALQDAAERQVNVFSEIAKLELRRWSDVNGDVIRETIQGIDQRRDCSDFYLLGLLGVMIRYMDNFAFPPELKQPLQDCVLHFRYWDDEPGSDAMCFRTENHSILFHACEILAGQLFPDQPFANTGQPGRWHKEKGERLALDWLRRRGTTGFSEWDSNCYFEEDLLALSHLTELAEHEQVWQLASVVMDKLFFTMAVNSFKGAFGSTHGRTYAPLIKGAHLESTSGISRLMWGMGGFNRHILGTVSLACARQYELPPIVAAIAAHLPEEMWNREHHPGVDKVTYKTPDYMLCSAQDYNPGQKGYQQHIWQATMGPDAVVFVTHPPCASEEGSRRPNFWHGNAVLPRVAQWKEVLIAVHKLPADDWMGFTHAYFPLYAFDEQAIKEGTDGRRWAFARKGEGYLALTAAQGFELVKRGPGAYRELRSYGRENVWVCHMGRAALDGAFKSFQEQVLALEVELSGLSARCATLRGERMAFGWEGLLLLNGQEQQITGFKHYENPYCVADLPAGQMDIQFGEDLMRLHFEEEEPG